MAGAVPLSDSLVAGAMAGVGTRFVIAPLDVLKVRLQLQFEPVKDSQSSKYHGMYHAAKTILREEGIRAFWKGTVPGQLMYAAFGAVEFTTYEATKGIISSLLPGRTAVNFTCGCVAGAVATIVTQPLDILKTRLIGQGEPKVYPTLFRAVVMMYAENGFRTFYQGLLPALLSVTPQAGLYFGFYHSFTAFWNATIHQQSSIANLRTIMCGSVAGGLSKILMLPLDLVKRRLEVQGLGFKQARLQFGAVRWYSGTADCVVSIFREDGLSGFYKGATPALVKAATSVGFYFLIYEHTLKLLGSKSIS